MDSWLIPHASLAVFSLGMAITSFWVKRSAWLWGGFLLLALILAYFAKLIQPIALAPIIGLLVLHALLKSEIRGLIRFLLFAATFAISLCLILNYLPGFGYWKILDKVQISQNGYPYSLGINFGKVFIGFFVLAWGLPLIRSMQELERVLRTAIPLAIGGIVILMTLSLFSGMIGWDPKWPKAFWFFLIYNLLFVTVMEEAFWRGCVQNEFRRWFGNKGLLASIGAILLTSLIFAGTHYFWIPSIPFLGLIFIASVIYGSIYQITRAIEASILCHWLVNVTHILLFTYPLLRGTLK